MKTVYWRTDIIDKDGVVDTAGALAVGFINLGTQRADLNTVIPLFPFGGINTWPQNIVWFPISEGEKDATTYRIKFEKVGAKALKNKVIVFVKLIKRDEKTDK